MKSHGHGAVAPAAILRGPGDAVEVDNPTGGVVSYWARGEETGGALTLMESVVPQGAGPPLHVHVNDDEFIYVLEGRLHVHVGGVVRETPAGSFILIPKGVRHTWQNTGTGDARFLFGFAPAAPGMERFFEQAAELPAASRLVEAFRRFAGAAGAEVVGPPLAQILDGSAPGHDTSAEPGP